MSLSNEQRLQVAQLAKEITIQFAGHLKYTDNSTSSAMNKNLSENISSLYVETYNTILNVVEGK
ncbi:hypothetical protein [Bacillus sp. 1NLA3E]|uniref:hypothetical protein n=1 Tax=Bacillus sp. 1NLA3E TaxID=666686 RepID=UPI000247E65B|nr:hypothetical protein [Bacillus sp. 1NLA3E]